MVTADTAQPTQRNPTVKIIDHAFTITPSITQLHKQNQQTRYVEPKHSVKPQLWHRAQRVFIARHTAYAIQDTYMYIWFQYTMHNRLIQYDTTATEFGNVTHKAHAK